MTYYIFTAIAASSLANEYKGFAGNFYMNTAKKTTAQKKNSSFCKIEEIL